MKRSNECPQRTTEFQHQWHTVFDNNISFSNLTFNIKQPTKQTEQMQKTQSKSKRDSENPNQLSKTSKRQKKEIFNMDKGMNAGINPSTNSYLKILKGYKSVAPKPFEITPTDQVIYSCQPAKSMKIFFPNHTNKYHYSSENCLAKTLNISNLPSTTEASSDINLHNQNFTITSSKTKLNSKEKTPEGSISLASASENAGFPTSNHSTKAKGISGDSSGLVNDEKRIDHLAKESNLFEAQTSNNVINNVESTSRNTIKIEMTDSDESENDLCEYNALLQNDKQRSIGDLFKKHYCFRVTFQLLDKFPELISNTAICEDIKLLIIYLKTPLFSTKNNGILFIDYVRLVVKSDETYSFQVFHKNIQTGKFDRNTIKRVLEMMTSKSYVLCKGISSIEKYKSFIDEDISQRVRNWVCIERIDSKDCLLWHHPSKRDLSDNELHHVCRICRELLHVLQRKMEEQ